MTFGDGQPLFNVFHMAIQFISQDLEIIICILTQKEGIHSFHGVLKLLFVQNKFCWNSEEIQLILFLRLDSRLRSPFKLAESNKEKDILASVPINYL